MSIIKKLNLTKYGVLTVINEPESYTIFDGFNTKLLDKQDCVFTFVFSLDELKSTAFSYIEKDVLENDGYLFFAYPKKNNKVYETWIHRDDILPGLGANEDGFVNNSNYKFSRMVALDDTFTVIGIKKVKKK